jgi:hypothetical protein
MFLMFDVLKVLLVIAFHCRPDLIPLEGSILVSVHRNNFSAQLLSNLSGREIDLISLETVSDLQSKLAPVLLVNLLVFLVFERVEKLFNR